MRRFLPFISAILVLLTFWAGTVARAAEPSVTPVAAAAHFDGDHDQVPADEHGPVPHHHGICHADQIGLTSANVAPMAEPVCVRAERPSAAPSLSSAEPGSALRPPIA